MVFARTVQNDIVLFEVSGKIFAGSEITLLYRTFCDDVTSGFKKFVVDLEGVLWSDSTGLGIFLGMLASVNASRGKLALANIASLHELLTMTRLLRVLDSYDSREEAVKSLSNSDSLAGGGLTLKRSTSHPLIKHPAYAFTPRIEAKPLRLPSLN